MVREGGRGGLMTGSRCQDCGNQAKKECIYIRCRSCCKSKGFHCQTHVKSTWIPVYERRRRHQIMTMTSQYHHPTITIPTQFIINPSISSSGLEEVNFPAEVNSTATFRSVRVRSAEDHMVDEHAYQTSVIIGGHVFNGILYDQGPDDQSTSSHHQHHVMKHTNHNFINDDAAAIATSRGTSVKTTAASTSTAAQGVPPHPPNSSYPFNAFRPGTQVFL